MYDFTGLRYLSRRRISINFSLWNGFTVVDMKP